MSSITFTLPSWPDIIDLDVLYQEIILWIFCGLFMTILPFIMIYYYQALHKLRYLIALRRRHFKLLTFLLIIILIDFMIIEPIGLLCGTYLSWIDILYWLYFILSTLTTHLILYTLLLKVWLVFYDIKWTKVCVIDDNQWRYHINNPLDDIKQDKTIKKEEKDEFEEHAQHIEATPKSDISFYVKHRQSFGNIYYVYKYAAFMVILSVMISLVSKCLLVEIRSTVLINTVILIPIILIYLLWLNTPPFDDIFCIRREVKSLLIYGLICVIVNSVVDIISLSNQDSDIYIELQLVLIFIYHILIFGVFMFLVYYPIKNVLILYGERIKGNIDSDRRTSIVSDALEDKDSKYCCLCCISQRFIHRIALFNAQSIGIGMGSAELEMVASSSHHALNIEMITQKQKEKRVPRENYKFNDITDIDGDEEGSLHYDDNKEEEEEEEMGVASKMSIESGEDRNTINFIPIKSPKKDVSQDTVSSNDTKFKWLETENGLNLFINHCAKEYSLENVLALIELNQFEIYCKKQEKLIIEQRELRIKTAKQRTAKKRESIKRAKRRQSKEIKNKILQYTKDNKERRYSTKQRRKKEGIKKKGKKVDIDDEDFILDEISCKPPIDTEVAFSDDADNDADGDDEDDEDISDIKAAAPHKLSININDEISNLPESTIIFNKTYIVHSKNKRIQQLEDIIIALCNKYIFYKSVFQLNLPHRILNEIKGKVNEMEMNRNINNGSTLQYNHSNNASQHDSDDDDMPPLPPQQLTNYSGSTYSLCAYPINYEVQLYAFFDHIMDCIGNLMEDSMYRLHQTN